MDNERTSIHVYKDHPKWGVYSKWFMMPAALLNSLYVVSFSVCDYHFSDELDQIEKEFPGHVFIHKGRSP